jgi:phosphoribosylformylglycinamidine cyclo-ligase
MLRTFNLGVGYVVIVRAADAERARQALQGAGESVTVIGEIVAGERGVELTA